jgi:glycosyltransferase involved in cell wall biosynthesis
MEMHRKYKIFGNDNCVVLRHGVEINAGDLENAARKRGKYVKNKSINVLYLGRVDLHKGLAVLTDAIKNTNRGSINWHIAGSGDYLDQMRHELRDYGNVTFHGWVTGTYKENLFCLCDVFVLPSICYEVAGLVILEAYKHGIPVIGSRIGGIPEMIKQDETGFLFEPGDEKGLAVILQNLSKEQLGKMKSPCLQAAMDHSMEHHLKRLTEVYQSLRETAQ